MKTERQIRYYLLFTSLFLTIGFSVVASASDWPHWRGPNYNGISEEKNWDPMKIKEGMEPLWKAEIGIGFSAVSVSDGKVVAMGNADDKDTIFCFDAETGEEKWAYPYGQQLDPKYYEGGTLASPTIEAGKVYTVSKDGKAYCIDMATGKLVWDKDLMAQLKFKRSTWGVSGSPLIIDDLIIYNIGANGLALNKVDGSIVWQSGEGPSGYSTAVPFNDKKSIAIFGQENLFGLDTKTGKKIWFHSWKTDNDVISADPIFLDDNTIFVSSGYGNGCGLLKVNGSEVTELWKNKNMRNKMNASVLWQGYIYGVDESGELRCLDVKTGEKLWGQRGFGQGCIAIADGKLLVMGEKGNLVVAEPTAESYKVISQAKILSSRCWTVPVLANGKLYVRNSKGTLLCLDVSCAGGQVSAKNQWAQWQGPKRDNMSTAIGLMKSWPEAGPKMLWSAKGIGSGFATVSIANDTIYTTGVIGGEGTLSAFDMQGKPKWKKAYGPAWTGDYPGTRSTPTIDDGRAYVVSGLCAITCFDAATGEIKWSKDTLKDYDGKYGKWGAGESPLVVDDKVICTPGGEKASLVAYNKKTGEIAWVAKGNGQKSSYCSPLLIEKKDLKLIVTMVGHGIIGVDASNGDVLWEYDCKNYQGRATDVNPNTPIYQDGCIYVTSGYGKGGAKLKLSDDGKEIETEPVWKNHVLDCHHGGVVLVDGYIYGTSYRGTWICLDWETGKEAYNTKGIGKGTVSFADGMLYCYDEKDGTVALVKPDPEKFEATSSFKVTMGKDQHWAHTVILDGVLYVRHGDALMAYDIKAK